MKIHEAIRNVQAEVHALDRDTATIVTQAGSNYSYRYVREGTVLDFLRPLLTAQGVATYISTEVVRLEGNASHVRATVTFVHHEDDSQVTITSDAVATDKGDKATAKAGTSAVRIGLLKCFLIPNDDPSADAESSSEPIQSAEQQSAREELLSFAEARGYKGWAQQELENALKASGGVLPTAKWFADAKAQIEKAPKPEAASAEPEKAQVPPPSDAPASPENGSQGAQTDQMAKLSGLIAALAELRADQDWRARAEKAAEQAFGKSDLNLLTEEEAGRLYERMENTRLTLAQEAGI